MADATGPSMSTLPLPKPEGPEPVCSHDLLTPPATQPTNRSPGLRSGGLAASSALRVNASAWTCIGTTGLR